MADGGVSFAISLAVSTALTAAASALAPPVEGPRLGDLSVSAATYGLPVVRGWGVVRLPANMIWTSGIKEESDTSKGKGLGKATTYTYSASFAMAFAQGPADRILKIWADNKLIYDETGDDASSVVAGGAVIRVYLGDENQIPDPTIEAVEGVGNVPAHRGIVYIVADNAPLEPFGNRIPNISALIAFNGAGETGVTNIVQQAAVADTSGLGGGTPSGNGLHAYDWERGLVYRLKLPATFPVGDWGIGVYELGTMTEIRQASLGDMLAGTGFETDVTSKQITGLAAADGGDLFIVTGTPYKLLQVDPVTLKVLSWFGPTNNAASLTSNMTSAFLPYGMIATKPNAGAPQHIMLWNSYTGPVLYTAGALGLEYLGGADTDTNALNLAAQGAYHQTCAVVGERSALGSTEFWVMNGPGASGPSTYNDLDIWRVYSVTASFGSFKLRTITAGDFWPGETGPVCMRLANYDAGNNQLIMHLDLIGYSAANDDYVICAISCEDGSTVWAIHEDASTNFSAGVAGGSRLLTNTYGYTAYEASTVTAGTAVRVIDTRTGARLYAVSPVGMGLPSTSAYDSVRGSIYQVTSDATRFQRLAVNRGQGFPDSLATVIQDICAACGLAAADIDVTALQSDLVRGFRAPQTSGRDLIQQLQAIYFFDSVESDDVLRFVKRGGASQLTIPYDDVLPPDDGKPALALKLGSADEMPRRVSVRYPDEALEQQTGTQHFARSQAPVLVGIVDSVGEVTVDTTVVMSASEAKTAAKRGLLSQWGERERLESVGLSPGYLRINPTDVVTITTPNGDAVRVRVEAVDVGADYSVRIDGSVEQMAEVWATAATGDAGFGLQPVPLYAGTAQPTQLLLANIPLLRDEDDANGTSLRIYGAAGPLASGGGFTGATVFRSPDAATWSSFLPISNAMAWGRTVGALPDHPAEYTDTTNTLRVRMVNGATRLNSATAAQVLEGANPAILVNPSGAVEVIQYTTVVSEPDGSYSLTGLLRGRRGSDWTTGSHAAGELFVLAEPAFWSATTLPLGQLGISQSIRTATLGSVFANLPISTSSFNGEAEKPWSPVHVAGTRDGSNNLSISWVRRSRIGGEWMDGTETVPLGEASEAYQVDVMSGATVLRTIAVTAATAVYSAANQTADGITPGAPVTVRVYQMSETVGRGHKAEATI